MTFFRSVVFSGIGLAQASFAQAAYRCELFDRAENAPGGDIPALVKFTDSNDFNAAKDACSGLVDNKNFVDYWLKWTEVCDLPADWQNFNLLGATFDNRVYSSSETLLPDLRNYCANVRDGEETYIYALPYNTAYNKSGIWGYAQGSLRGCGSDKLTFEGGFADLSTLDSTGKTSFCSGTLNLAQTQSELAATWKIGENSLGSTKCSQSVGETFTLTLQPTTMNQLTTKSLSLYEYELSRRPSAWEETSAKFALKVVASSGLPGVDFGRDGETKITFKTGSSLQSFHCDRGGADFPESGVCYRLNDKGEAWGVVLEKSEATPRGYATRKARLNRADLKLEALQGH